MKRALVVIDMQSEYAEAREKTLKKNIIQSIKKAKKDKVPIIFVEFDGAGVTLPEFKKLVNGYKKTSTAKKHSTCGASVIEKCIKRRRWDIDRLDVCGIYTDCCVGDTVESLSAINKWDIKVLSKACYPRKKRMFYSLQIYNRVKIAC